MLKATTSTFLLCFLFHLCWNGPTVHLTAAAPTSVVYTAAEVSEHVVKRDTDSDEALRSQVETAVNNSLSDLNVQSVNKEALTTSILNELKASGVGEECQPKCKPLTKAELAQKFLEKQTGVQCLSLQEISLDSVENGLTIYAVSGNSTCQRLQLDGECFANSPPACSWTTHFTEISYPEGDYFPQYMVDVDCHQNGNVCQVASRRLEFRSLRKVTDGCDDLGYEKWIEVQVEVEGENLNVNGGCNCYALEY